MILPEGSKFRAYTDSIGNSSIFWVDTLSFKMTGSFIKGDILELRDFYIDAKKITFTVETIEEGRLDKDITDVVVPVSMVGMDKDLVLEPHQNVIYTLLDTKNDNKIFLMLLKVPYNKTTKIKLPLPGTGNIVEYIYQGL